LSFAAGTNLKGVRMRKCVFEDCDLSMSNWSESELEDVVFGRCVARFSVHRAAAWKRVTAIELDAESADASDAKWLNCDLSQIALRFGSLRGALLSQCVLLDADLCGVDARRADFNASNVADADLRGALLHGADFTAVRGHANVDGLDPAAECAVPPPLRPSHNTITAADLESAKIGDHDSDGLRLAPDVAAVAARAFGVVDAAAVALTTEPLAIARLVDGTTFERHPNRLLRVIGPPPMRLTLVRHAAVMRAQPLTAEEQHLWRSLADDLAVYDPEQRQWSQQRCSLSEAVVLKSRSSMSTTATTAGAGSTSGTPASSPREAVVPLMPGGWCEALPDDDGGVEADADDDDAGGEPPNRPNSFMIHRPCDYQDSLNLLESLGDALGGDALRNAINRLRALSFDERRHSVLAAASPEQRWKWVEACRVNLELSSAGFFSPLQTACLTLAVGGTWATPECTVDWQNWLIAQLENIYPSVRGTQNMLGLVRQGKLPWLERKRIDDSGSSTNDAVWSLWLPSPSAFDEAANDLVAKKRDAAPSASAAVAVAVAAATAAAPVAKKKKTMFGFLRRLKSKKGGKEVAAASSVKVSTPVMVAKPNNDDDEDDKINKKTDAEDDENDEEEEDDADEKAFGQPGTVATLSRETLKSFSLSKMAAAEAAATATTESSSDATSSDEPARKTKKKKRAKMHGSICARCGERSSAARAVMSDGSKLRLCLACIDVLKTERDVKLRERERAAAAEEERKRRAILPAVVGDCACCHASLSDNNTKRRSEFFLAARNADALTPFGLPAKPKPAPVVQQTPVVAASSDKKSKKSSSSSSSKKGEVVVAPPTDAELVERVAELERTLASRDETVANLQLTVNEMRARLMRFDAENNANTFVEELLSSLMQPPVASGSGTVRVSTEQSLFARQVEALSARLAQEFEARQQLESRLSEQAQTQFEHLQNAQMHTAALQRRVDAQSDLLAKLALSVCDGCVGKFEQ
jgi:uncharacterized protein YjbI with pentapeptide repeats